MEDELPIFGKHQFSIGQRVRPSHEGVAANLFKRKHWNASGVVVKVDDFNSPTVRWDHIKTPSRYAANFIEPDNTKAIIDNQKGE